MLRIVLHNKKYHIGRIFRTTWKHLRHDIQPEIYACIIIMNSLGDRFARNNAIISVFMVYFYHAH